MKKNINQKFRKKIVLRNKPQLTKRSKKFEKTF